MSHKMVTPNWVGKWSGTASWCLDTLHTQCPKTFPSGSCSCKCHEAEETS